MPIFEYQCNTCSHEFEKLVFVGDEPDIACPKCDSHEVTKKMSAVSFMGQVLEPVPQMLPKTFREPAEFWRPCAV